MEALGQLRKDPRFKSSDQARLESELNTGKVLRDQYAASYREYLLRLLATLGIAPNAEYVLEEEPYRTSEYVERSRSPEGLQQLIEDAYRANPTLPRAEERGQGRRASARADHHRQAGYHRVFRGNALPPWVRSPTMTGTRDGNWELG